MLEDSTPTHKRCSRCDVTKPLTDFNASKSGKYGRHNHCRECQRVIRRTWYQTNREEELAKVIAYNKTDKCKEERKRRYQANREEIRAKDRARCKTEAYRVRARIRAKRYRDGLKGHPTTRIGNSLRKRIHQVLRGVSKKKARFIKLLGCSTEHLVKHLESTWQPGMSWENYGVNGWHIDHIIPCIAFDLTKEEEQYRCFHWTNLQALWAKDNILKKDFVPDYQI